MSWKYEMEIERLQARIEQLEAALSRAGLPCDEFSCACCKQMYMPRSYDDIRCNDCCYGCYTVIGTKIWVQGSRK